MKDLKNFLNLITRYLNQNENTVEKQELYDWYDKINVECNLSDDKHKTVGSSIRNRLLETIGSKELDKRSRLRQWISIAAASAILLSVGVWLYTFKYNNSLSPEELSTYFPSKEGNTQIHLPNGEVVNLDKIGLDESLLVGNVLIKKGANGEISYHTQNPNLQNTGLSILETAESSNAKITLSDGTIVYLNSDSKLTYPLIFGVGDREVTLEGEGYFIVKKTEKLNKFIVKSSGQRVEVLGTKFNIKTKFTNKIKTTLEEGSVKVYTSKGDVLLAPLQQAVLSVENIGVQLANIEEVLAWTKGYFYFDGNNTSEVLNQIERWYNIQISYDNKDAGNIPYIGKIPKNLSLNNLIKLLSFADFEVDAKRNESSKINLTIK